MSISSVVYKGHGTGNDFVVYIDAEGTYDPTVDEVQQLCNRHYGIGGDGLLRLTHPEYVQDLSAEVREACKQAGAIWFMDYRNADGSVAQMCGNGTRVSALMLHTLGLADDGPIALGTRAGVKILTPLGVVDGLGTHVYCVDMGQWHSTGIPSHTVTAQHSTQSQTWGGTYVDMGNPHIVSVLNNNTSEWDAASALLQSLNLSHAPVVTPGLAEGQNIEFIAIQHVPQIDSTSEHNGSGNCGEASMRVHERGVGETLSCGTGLCASAVTLRAVTGVGSWRIRIPGGVVQVDVTDSNVRLTGDAQLVAHITLM